MISETLILKRKSSPNEDFVCSENIISALSDNFKVKTYQVWHVLKKSHGFVKSPPSMFFFSHLELKCCSSGLENSLGRTAQNYQGETLQPAEIPQPGLTVPAERSTADDCMPALQIG